MFDGQLSISQLVSSIKAKAKSVNHVPPSVSRCYFELIFNTIVTYTDNLASVTQLHHNVINSFY